ncbi:MAG: hypothetical protein IPJ48_16645 [Propionivibrio sp.]|uniref:Uncharacterized protein n=1 Tax=Candidatus Propionivibrio dominans TaxID=2954373 RepID=A0A9D7FHX9_9RHOO|nr:hypothetical protein [Candidatus Propionivibrio dominans]
MTPSQLGKNAAGGVGWTTRAQGRKTPFQRDGSMHIVSQFMVRNSHFTAHARLKTAPRVCKATISRNTRATLDGRIRALPFPTHMHLAFGLPTEGSAAWYAFDQARRATLLPEKLEIGMEFLTAAVEH